MRAIPLSGYHRILRRVLILIVILIVYGSLYPWHFVPARMPAHPLLALLHSWPAQRPVYFIRDSIVNVTLYMPLGLAAHLALRRGGLRALSLFGPLVLGAILSTSMEILQLMEPMRTTSMFDVMTNVAGAAGGVLIGLLPGPADRLRLRGISREADRGAVVLLFCWAAWLFFPFFPVVGLYQPRMKLKAFVLSGLLDPDSVMAGAAAFFAAGLLLTAARVRPSRGLIFTGALLVPAEILVAGRQPHLAEWVGAIAGLVLFALRRHAAPAVTTAWLFLATIALRGMSPFHFVSQAAPFSWIPFIATIEGDWQSSAAVFMGKLFFYGAAIWLFRTVGFKMLHAIAVVAPVLALIEALQTHLPGRTPEITDPVIAVLMGFVLWALGSARVNPSRGKETQFQSTG